MLLTQIAKEPTDYTRARASMVWWLDPDETLTTVVSSEISLGTAGWSEAPYPPLDSPPPEDPTPLEFRSVTIDADRQGFTAFVDFGTPGNVYTMTFVLEGSSTRRITVEIGVQVTGMPPSPTAS
jgi:hypothetical protein